MSTPHDLIRAIIDEDFVAAKEITNNLVFTAVSDELEVAKMEVASTLFPTEDAVDEAVTAKRIRILRKAQRTGKPVTGDTKDWMNRSYARKLYKLKSKEKGLGESEMSANRYGGGKPFFPNAPKKGSAATVAGGKGLHKGNMSAKDFDQDGKIESPKDEVHGSHINAAVKSRKLSPNAASKTKSKGKYR